MTLLEIIVSVLTVMVFFGFRAMTKCFFGLEETLLRIARSLEERRP